MFHERTEQDVVKNAETHLEFVEKGPMMKVSVRKYPINTSTYGSQLGYWRFLDADPVWKKQESQFLQKNIKTRFKVLVMPSLSIRMKMNPSKTK